MFFKLPSVMMVVEVWLFGVVVMMDGGVVA